ncbi:MAG: hypothetical protein CMH60_04750 [Myxococcales bacterium]|nr:hypothetical protein [Myxococcales bacterium]
MANFIYDEPVGGKQCFVGRQKQLRSILQQILHARDIILCGGPKTGRTSMLEQLAVLLEELPENTEGQGKVLPIYVDLDAVYDKRKNVFYERIAKLIKEGFSGAGMDVEHPEHGLRLKFGLGEELSNEFDSLLQEIRDVQRGKKTWCSYVLFFDNADLLISEDALDLLDHLGGLSQHKDSWGPQAIIFSGGRRVRDYNLELRSALSTFRPHFLGPLKVDEFAALLKPLERFLSEPQLDAIEAASGRHPYVTQRVCAEIANLEGNDSLDQALENASDELQALFERLWDEFDLDRGVTYKGVYAAPEHALMQFLQDNMTGVELAWAEEELSISPLKEYMEFLEFAGVAERGLSGNAYVYSANFDLWNYWYQQRLLV